MKFDEIPNVLEQEDCICINGGEVMLKKKLASVIGGVNIYHIMADFPKERLEPVFFETMDELDDFSLLGGEDKKTGKPINIRRCCVCGELPTAKEQEERGIVPGYYHDYEMEQDYCSRHCLHKWLDSVYGDEEAGWELRKASKWSLEDDIYVQKPDKSGLIPYKVEFVPPYDFINFHGR